MTARTATLPALRGRLAGAPLVLLLDVDGTLAPIAAHPDAAAVPVETRAVIERLAARPDVRVALVSGRSAADARRLVGVPAVWAAGNHGFEITAPDGSNAPHPAALAYQAALAAAATELTEALAPIDGAFVEDKGLTLSVHYRLAAPHDAPRVHALATAAGVRHGLRTSEGKMVVEVRPPVPIDKGTAVIALTELLGASTGRAAILFAGDDATDEDGFRSLRAAYPTAVTIHVGPRVDSTAEFTVTGPEALRSLLAAILEARVGQRPLDRSGRGLVG